jgi:hypothetical protein
MIGNKGKCVHQSDGLKILKLCQKWHNGTVGRRMAQITWRSQAAGEPGEFRAIPEMK